MFHRGMIYLDIRTICVCHCACICLHALIIDKLFDKFAFLHTLRIKQQNFYMLISTDVTR